MAEEGGDPPCWAHLFEDPDAEALLPGNEASAQESGAEEAPAAATADEDPDPG